MKKLLGIFLILTMIIFLIGCSSEKNSKVEVREDLTAKETTKILNEDNECKIYLISMDQGSNFWQQIDSGCKQAIKETGGINYKWIASANHKVDEQAECIDKAVADGADAILISAISVTDLNENLKRLNSIYGLLCLVNENIFKNLSFCRRVK